MLLVRGRLHGELSTPGLKSALLTGLKLFAITWSIFNPGVELSPVNRVEIFCDYMDDFNPGVETLYYTFSASIRGSKKSLYFVFL
jgi:hypothetical protein